MEPLFDETEPHFKMVAGDNKILELRLLTDRGGYPLNLSGVTLIWHLHRWLRLPAVLTKRTDDGGIAVVDALAGRCDVLLNRTEDTRALSGHYLHEIAVLNNDQSTEHLLFAKANSLAGPNYVHVLRISRTSAI